MDLPPFAALAASPAATLEELALAFAKELREEVDVASALLALDALGAELGDTLAATAGQGGARAQADALVAVLGAGGHGFAGDDEVYDDPEASMLDRVLQTRRGLPILLSAVYEETARRAGLPVWGVGLPGHFVVAHFGGDPPIVLDPFRGGVPLPTPLAPQLVRRWSPHETALRMLTNLINAYTQGHDLTRAIRCARLRMLLPSADPRRQQLAAELLALEARLN